MNTSLMLLSLLMLTAAIPVRAADETTPPPVSVAPPRASSAETFTYEQKPISGTMELISDEKAEQIVKKFRAAYKQLGSPRVLIYVNRELVDERTGLKLAGRTEKVISTQTEGSHEFVADPKAPQGSNTISVTVNPQVQAGRDATIMGVGTSVIPGKQTISKRDDSQENINTYAVREKPLESIKERNFVREGERLVGQKLRGAGVSLADQKIAAQLIADRPLSQFTTPTEGEQARKDRESLANVCDVVIELLAELDRKVVVTSISGDQMVTVPQVQLTAIRIKDSKIIGQASSDEFLGRRNARAVWISKNFRPNDIAEATALKLMEDIVAGSTP